MKIRNAILVATTILLVKTNAFVVLNEGFDTPATWTPGVSTSLAIGTATEVSVSRTPPLLGTIPIDDWSYDIFSSEAVGWNSTTGVVGPPSLMPQSMPQCIQFMCRAGIGGGGEGEGGGGGGCGFNLFGTFASLTAGVTYDVTFFHKVIAGGFSVVVENFTFGAFGGQANGTDINTPIFVGPTSSASNVWDSTTISFMASSSIHQIQISGGGAGYNQYFDSFSITQVPEPSITLLSAFSALFLLRRTRR